MNASAYLKRRLLAERKIALSLEKGIQESVVSAGKTLDDIYSGIERISWYSSCFIDRHQDICRQLKAEDIRMIKAVMMLYKHKDVIAEILFHYFNYLLKDDDPVRVRRLTVNTSRFTAEMLAGRTAKSAMAYSLAKGFSESALIIASVRKALNTIAFQGFSIMQFYGKIQKAVMAARRLKILEPQFYNILYLAELDMFYIYLEPFLSQLITEIKSLPQPDVEKILEIIKRYQS